MAVTSNKSLGAEANTNIEFPLSLAPISFKEASVQKYRIVTSVKCNDGSAPSFRRSVCRWMLGCSRTDFMPNCFYVGAGVDVIRWGKGERGKRKT